MNERNANDDGPKRFIRNWLMFDESRPARPRLLRNFIVLVAASFAVTALLALIGALMR